MASDADSGGASVVFGVSGGLVTACMLGGGAAFVVEERLEHQYRQGWNLIPLVVAASDLEEGELITLDQISQRSVPEQFVTTAMVLPDSYKQLMNATIHRPVHAGDPMTWRLFVSAVQSRLNAEVARQRRTFTPDR